MGTSAFTGDARGLSADALEVLRRRAVAAVEAGRSRAEVARLFGISRKTVGAWVSAYRSAGDEALRPKTRGRRHGEQLALSPSQQAWTIESLIAGTPDTHGLNYPLWTRQAVAELVNHRFRIPLSATTVTHYLTRWGLLEDEARMREMMRTRVATILPPLTSGAEVVAPWLPEAEVCWLAWTRPHAPAETDNGRIAAGQNLLTGFRSHFGDVNVVFALSSRGVLFFQAGLGPFDAVQIRDFLRHLMAHFGHGLNVLVCRWPVRYRDVLDPDPDAYPGRIRVQLSVLPG